MLESSKQIKVKGVKSICVVLAILLGCMTWSSSCAAWAESDSWFDWLFRIFAADGVPQRPKLTEEDRIAIQKARLLLGSYTADTANSLMLGILAAADSDANQARMYFTRARVSDRSGSLLPLTMAAQTYLQEGDYHTAKLLHEQVLDITRKRPSPVMQKINAHLDLAVACSKLNQRDEATKNAKEAEQLILTSQLSNAEKAFAYFQSGLVYTDSLQDRDDGLRAYTTGVRLSQEDQNSVDPRIPLELNLKVIESLPKGASYKSLEKYFKGAENAADRLVGESRVVAQTRIGEQFATLAIDRKDAPEATVFSNLARRLLAPAQSLQLEGLNAQMIIVKARAIESEKGLASAEGDKVKVNALNQEMQKVEGSLVTEVRSGRKGRVP